MRIGAMNHPAQDVAGEIEWMAEAGLEFIDLTLEPPRAASWQIDVRSIRDALERHRLPAVGHTAYYLPIASAVEELRQAALGEMRRCLRIFAELGVRWMNIHPDGRVPLHPRELVLRRNLESLSELLGEARRLGVGLMVENLPADFNCVPSLGALLDPLPELGLHLDLGHTNLSRERGAAQAIIRAYGARIRHVHLHDNPGNGDLHLPLGTGTVDVEGGVRALKAAGYDGTITLEVFSPDRRHLFYSRDVLRRMWDGEARA